jgi:Rad3-related DNA helicase
VTDVGVVVVLDSRLGPRGKHYRHEFFRSIPPLPVKHSLDDIAPFLREKGAL